ncbi:gliding motility-associated C-terminal domain-containing protein, partial [Fulvivirga kasyanovii]
DATTFTDGQIIEVEAVSAACGTFTETITLNINTTPTLSLTQSPDPGLCTGSSVEVSATSGFDTYEFRDGVGGPVLQAASVDNTFDATTFTDGQVIEVEAVSATCGTFTSTITININATPSLNLTQNPSPACSGVLVEILATSGFDTYEFRDGVGGPVLQAASVDNTFDATTFTDGQVIEVEAVSATCGTFTETITLDINASSTLVLVQNPDPGLCTGSSIEVSATTGFDTYEFRDGVGGPVLQAASVDNTFDATTFTDGQVIEVEAVSVTCGTFTETITLNINASASVNLVQSPAAACAGTLVTLTATTGFDTYEFRDGVGGPVLQAASANNSFASTSFTDGQIIEVVAVSASCGTFTSTLPVNILPATDPACSGGSNCFAFTKSIVSITRPDCDDNNGAFRLEITGTTSSGLQVIFEAGSGLGSYSVAFPSNTLVIAEDSLSAGIYRYSISDGAGNTCSFADSFIELKELSSVDAELLPGSETAVTCFGDASGTATLTGLSGSFTGDYWYNASGIYVPLGNDRIVRNLSAGTTTILVAGAKPDGSINLSCPAEVDVTIFNSNPQITLTTSTTDASCDNNDGSITVTSISGGTGSYSYRLDGVVFNDLPSGGKFENMAGGNHILTVIDDGVTGCERDFNIVVPFPGLVDFSTNPVDPDCSNNTASNGEIEVIIHSIGQFQVGISTDQTTDPTEFFDVSSNGFGSFTFDDLAKGDYYVTVVSTGATCPNRRLVSISDGPSAVNFDYKLGCITGGVNRELLLSNIKGENTSQYTLRVFDNFTSDLVDEITFTLNSGQQFLIQNRTFLNFNKEYRLRLVQEQAACPGVEIIYEHPDILRIPTKLFALVGETTSSLPDKFTGSMQIHEFSGGEPPYLIRIELDSAAVPGQSYITDYDTVRLNNNLEFERIYEDIPAGRYFIEVSDELGCVLPLTGRVPLNTDLFVPNIFTPNGDGYNDTFFVRNLPEFDVELVVTNRWGTEVYKSDDYKNDWTGDDIPDGIYFYKIDVAGEVYNGWVEIMRGKP